MTQATSGLSALIARIRQDGVDAGQAERARLLSQAEAEAQAILARARAEADAIRAEAERQAQERANRLEGELRMASRDFVYRMHDRIHTQVIEPLAREATEAALADPQRLAALIAELVLAWGRGGQAQVDPRLRAELEQALAAALAAKAAAGTVELKDEQGLRGFRLIRQGEHFVWDVSVDTVARELASLVEPTLRELLLPARGRDGGGWRIVPSGAGA